MYFSSIKLVDKTQIFLLEHNTTYHNYVPHLSDHHLVYSNSSIEFNFIRLCSDIKMVWHIKFIFFKEFIFISFQKHTAFATFNDHQEASKVRYSICENIFDTLWSFWLPQDSQVLTSLDPYWKVLYSLCLKLESLPVSALVHFNPCFVWVECINSTDIFWLIWNLRENTVSCQESRAHTKWTF